MAFIKVEFASGGPLLIDVTGSHTVQVIGLNGSVQDSFSFDGVTGLSLEPGNIPAAASVETLPLAVAEPLPDTTTTPIPADEASAVVTLPPVTVPDTSAQPMSDPNTVLPPPVIPAVVDHEVAVASAQETVAVATQVVNDPETPVAVAEDHLGVALADVEAALATFPDSAPLLDAKAQLDALAAQVTPPPAA